MTVIDWNKDRVRRLKGERGPDALPPTGSAADMRRYGVYPGRKLTTSRPVGETIALSWDVLELQRYARHCEHLDFLRKSHSQRQELLSVLIRLIQRCERWGEHHAQVSSAVGHARSVLRSRQS